jgi:hypothetical protein
MDPDPDQENVPTPPATPGTTTPVPPGSETVSTAPAPPGGEDETDNSLDLLAVAAVPILKRLLPAVGGAIVLTWLGLRLRRRTRHHPTT